MKTKKSIITILAVIVVLISSAVEKPKMNIQSLNSDQVLVTVQNKEASDVEVTIYDNDGTLVYYKISNKPINSFNKIFDFKNLENGKYAMQVNLNGLTHKRDLKITSEKIYVGNPENESAPHFANRNEQLIISHLNFENNNYWINIYDESGLVFEKKIGNQSPLHSGFDLSELNPGDYTVILDSGKKNFQYRFVH
jgi:hypothetical protein